MLAENPPPPHHALVLDQFARIGIGPGLDVEAQPDVVKQGLIRAAAIGMPLLRQHFLSGDWATVVNGWRYPPPEEGRFGDDFLRRAADQSLAGITANDPAEVGLPGELRRRRRREAVARRAGTNCASTPTTCPRWTRSGRWPPTPKQT